MPDWLRYDPVAMQLIATAPPADGLPLRLVVHPGNHQTAELLIDLR